MANVNLRLVQVVRYSLWSWGRYNIRRGHGEYVHDIVCWHVALAGIKESEV